MSIAPLLVSLINSVGLGYLVSRDKDRYFMLSIIAGFVVYILAVGGVVTGFFKNVSQLNVIAAAYDIGLLVSAVMVLVLVKVSSRESKHGI